MTRINILNYLEARTFEPAEPTLIVRVFDPDASKPEHNLPSPLRPSSFWLDQIELSFEDIDLCGYEREAIGQFIMLRRERRCFELPMAQHLLREAARTIHQAASLVVHCNAGMSRSPAVAWGLVHRFNLTPELVGRRKKMMTSMQNERRYGNEWVYRTIMDAEQ